MSNLLSSIKRGPTMEPLRILVHGQEGVGKTTFAARCPHVLFLTAEDGGGDLDYARVVLPSWDDLRRAVRDLIDDGTGEFQTIAIDTIDAFQRLLWQKLCDMSEVESIEQIGGGFGKGYTAAAENMAALQRDLDTLRTRRRTNIILIAHSHVRPFNNPMGAPFDRFEIRLHKGTADLWKDWSDAILFACLDVTVMKSGKKGKAVEAGAMEKGKAVEAQRVLYTTKDAAYDAKNRHNLPEEIPLTWRDFAKAIDWDRRVADIRAQGAAPPPNWRDFKPAGETMEDDASFTTEARANFVGHLAKAGLRYEDVAEWTLSLGHGRPSWWPAELRKSLAKDLANGARKEFDAWQAKRQQAAA